MLLPKVLSFVALVAVVFLARPAFADDLSYDDPAMHFRAPDGWQRINLGDTSGNDDAPAAVWVLTANKNQPRSITITISNYQGSLDEFATSHQTSLRTSVGDNGVVLTDHKDQTKLANGMPVVYFVWTLSTDKDAPLKNYEDLFIDGQRSIAVKFTGYAGDVTDADAAAALSSLYAVAYPRRRPDSQ